MKLGGPEGRQPNILIAPHPSSGLEECPTPSLQTSPPDLPNPRSPRHATATPPPRHRADRRVLPQVRPPRRRLPEVGGQKPQRRGRAAQCLLRLTGGGSGDWGVGIGGLDRRRPVPFEVGWGTRQRDMNGIWSGLNSKDLEETQTVSVQVEAKHCKTKAAVETQIAPDVARSHEKRSFGSTKVLWVHSMTKLPDQTTSPEDRPSHEFLQRMPVAFRRTSGSLFSSLFANCTALAKLQESCRGNQWGRRGQATHLS